MIRLPGLIDVHVHLRQPGGEHKETVASGTAAALAGGVVGVLEMPNTIPPTLDAASLALKQAIHRANARCDTALFLGADGRDLTSLRALAGQVAGLKLYLGQTFGGLTIVDTALLPPLWEAWPGPGPICVHVESPEQLVQPLALTARYGTPLHVAHVSSRELLRLVLDAKDRGLPVTCETTPTYLWLTRDDEPRLGPFARVKPPLGSAEDRAALWQHLDDIDCLATDHAPHSREEKLGSAPPPGLPGVETLLPLMLTALHEGRLTVRRLVELTHENPQRVYPITAPADSWVEVEPEERYTLRASQLLTKCSWTPFEGTGVVGRVVRTWLRGRLAYEAGTVLAEPGSGRDMVNHARLPVVT